MVAVQTARRSATSRTFRSRAAPTTTSDLRTTGAPCGVATVPSGANGWTATAGSPPGFPTGCEALAPGANPSDAPSLPLTAQTRVRIPAGSLGQEAGVAEEIPAAPASGVAGAAGRTTGGPKVSAVVRLLTVREVAERLAVCTATVYALVERGELPHLQVSNTIRIRPADPEAFIAGKRGSSGNARRACKGPLALTLTDTSTT